MGTFSIISFVGFDDVFGDLLGTLFLRAHLKLIAAGFISVYATLHLISKHIIHRQSVVLIRLP